MASNTPITSSKQKREYYYSIGIIILIPVLIVVNTLFLTSSVRSDYNLELQRRAADINAALAVSLVEDVNDQEKLQILIKNLIARNDEIELISIIVPAESGADGLLPTYRITASSDDALVNTEASGQLLTTAIGQERPIATQQTLEDGTDTWAVANKITNGDEVVGFVISNFGFDRVNALVVSIYNQSLIIMFVILAVVFLLLINHFRYVNYSVLFKKLQEVDQLKNDFLSVATHELKSPMGTIKGALENITDGIFGPVDEKVQDSINLALRETNRLSNLVADLLNVSRIEQGRITYNMEPVRLSDSLRQIVKQYEGRASDKGIAIKYVPGETTYTVMADAGRILEIFTNLIDNAIKYSERGEVTVTHEVEKNNIKTIVRDTGIGMTPEEREKLFSRFYRVQNDKTAQISGTGLGLWIIKQYIEAMKGKIFVDSIQDVGTSFTVEFPLHETKQQNNQHPREN